jgi:adenosylhomocysteine nucleosidase
MKILFIASDRMEFPGILRRATAIRPAALPVHWSRFAQINGNPSLLVANGAGPSHAARAAKIAIEAFRPDAVVNTGFCGALSPSLAIADLIAADRILSDGQIFDASTLPGPCKGSVRSITYVAQTARQKQNLAADGAIAVEMEAAGVAPEAFAHSLPFYCIRAVTDLAGETMANDFNKALRSDGHFDTISILRVALVHPGTCLPELIRLRKRCIRAAGALGDFFADSRF